MLNIHYKHDRSNICLIFLRWGNLQTLCHSYLRITLVLLVYDYFLTLELEKKHVWAARLSLPKILFFFVSHSRITQAVLKSSLLQIRYLHPIGYFVVLLCELHITTVYANWQYFKALFIPSVSDALCTRFPWFPSFYNVFILFISASKTYLFHCIYSFSWTYSKSSSQSVHGLFSIVLIESWDTLQRFKLQYSPYSLLGCRSAREHSYLKAFQSKNVSVCIICLGRAED